MVVNNGILGSASSVRAGTRGNVSNLGIGSTSEAEEDRQQIDGQATDVAESSIRPALEEEHDVLELNTRPIDPSSASASLNHHATFHQEQATDQTNILTLKQHNIPRSQLPIPTQTSLHHRSTQTRFSNPSISKSTTKLSKKIGPIPWNPDTTNTFLVQTAIREVQLDDFKTAAEKHRFLVGPAVWYDNLQALQGSSWIVDAHQLLLIRQLGIIDALPSLTTDELEATSRADALVTLLALSQVLWFIVQLITRLVLRHPTTQLEIVTLAFSICSTVTYSLLWEKPKDVQTTMFVNAIRYPTPQELSRIAVLGPYIFGQKRRSLWIPNNAIHWESVGGDRVVKPMKQFNFGVALSIIIFGTVHCIAWNFTFPTAAEQRMWQVTSILSISIMPVAILVLVVFWKWAETEDGRSVEAKRGLAMIFTAFAVVFAVARGFVVVEALRSLAYLPPGAFLTTWTEGWPHLGLGLVVVEAC